METHILTEVATSMQEKPCLNWVFCRLGLRGEGAQVAFLSAAIFMQTAHTQIESLIIIGTEAGNQTLKTESTMTIQIEFLV